MREAGELERSQRMVSRLIYGTSRPAPGRAAVGRSGEYSGVGASHRECKSISPATLLAAARQNDVLP